MNIEYDLKNQNLTINGKSVRTDDGETWYVPRKLLKGVFFNEMPNDILFQICDRHVKDIIYSDTVSYTIKKVADRQATICFYEGLERMDFDEDEEDGWEYHKQYLKDKYDFVKEYDKKLGVFHSVNFKQNDDFISLEYSMNVEAISFEDVMISAEEIDKEILRLISTVYEEKTMKSECTDTEKVFSLKILLPLFRKLGFSHVRYNHGISEFGKDITFVRITEFDDLEHWGVQVKYGNVSGGSRSDIDTIVSQIDDAFKLPFYDVYSKNEIKISKLIIAISGKYTNNAIHKICNKIENSSAKSNTLFFDGDKIDSLNAKYAYRRLS